MHVTCMKGLGNCGVFKVDQHFGLKSQRCAPRQHNISDNSSLPWKACGQLEIW